MRKIFAAIGLSLSLLINALSLVTYSPYFLNIALLLAGCAVALAYSIVPFLQQPASKLFDDHRLKPAFYDAYPKRAKLYFSLIVVYAILLFLYFHYVTWDYQIKATTSGYISIGRSNIIQTVTKEEFDLYHQRINLVISGFCMVFYYVFLLILKYNKKMMR